MQEGQLDQYHPCHPIQYSHPPLMSYVSPYWTLALTYVIPATPDNSPTHPHIICATQIETCTYPCHLCHPRRWSRWELGKTCRRRPPVVYPTSSCRNPACPWLPSVSQHLVVPGSRGWRTNLSEKTKAKQPQWSDGKYAQNPCPTLILRVKLLRQSLATSRFI